MGRFFPRRMPPFSRTTKPGPDKFDVINPDLSLASRTPIFKTAKSDARRMTPVYLAAMHRFPAAKEKHPCGAFDQSSRCSR